jgi:DNA-binding NtrC family response regulator
MSVSSAFSCGRHPSRSQVRALDVGLSGATKPASQSKCVLASPVLSGMNAASTAPTAVLVIDDQALLRMLATDVLEEAGFRAIEAASADAALHALGTYPEVRVVFTDMQMPGSLDGLELARAVHEHWPQTGVLIVSGRGSPSPRVLPPGARFVLKSYQPEIVVGHLARAKALSRTSGGRRARR